MKNTKKVLIAALAVVLVVGVITAIGLSSLASDLPFTNLFIEGFAGYTSDEGEILAADLVSSKPIAVSEGETVWFGPCDTAQYFHLVGQDGENKAVTDKIRGKELTVTETFGNGTVIYQYTVPAGVENLVFSVPTSVKTAFVISKTEVTAVNYLAYWSQQGVDTDPFVGQNSYYEVKAGDKLYIGVITEESAVSSVVYNSSGNPSGTIELDDLRLVENFGGAFSIYCYTVPSDADIAYVRISYDAKYEQYYNCYHAKANEEVDDKVIVDSFIRAFGVVRPLDSTIKTLSGKSALFLGDSITFGARDRANIYGVVDSVNPGAGGWAARIGYYAGMNVTNNGVSGACITTARRESSSEAHYIYNNLVKTEGTTYDYVIMHGLFNDASEKVAVGTMQGKENFDPAKADVTTYAGGLELLFHQARVQNPDAILGFIVNFQTERSVDQKPYVDMAIAICENWGIEYLDLYNRPGFTVEFDDGLHPSSAGYDSMYTIVANWMAGLDGKLDEVKQTTSSAEVMSYNVFWNPVYEGIANRTDKVLSLITGNASDIIMFQEVSPDWMTLLNNKLTGYSHYGYSHKKGVNMDQMTGNDEGAPIYWKTDKYELVDSGYVLTVDNGIVSDYPRCINWVVLKDKTTGGMITAMNIHADPNDQVAREKTNLLVVNTLDEIRGKHGDVAAVLGGDWNMQPKSTTYFTVVGNGLLDARYVAETTTTSGSYNAWNRVEGKYGFGDYLFVSEGVEASLFEVVADWDPDNTGLHVSDHCPIIAQIEF